MSDLNKADAPCLGYRMGSVLEYSEALQYCWKLLEEAEKDEINIFDEMEKWKRAYGHLLRSEVSSQSDWIDLEYISNTPTLTGLLYDLNLLPHQVESGSEDEHKLYVLTRYFKNNAPLTSAP